MNRPILAGLLILVSALAHPQPGPGLIRSLESMVADSVLIVHGTATTRPEPALKLYGGSQTVIQVKETLKGSPQSEVVVPTFRTQSELGDGDVLAFLLPASQSPYTDEIHKAFPHTYYALGIVRLEGKGPLAMSLSMERLYEGVKVLEAVRTALKVNARKEDPKSWSFMLPTGGGALPPHSQTGMGVLFTVPVDKRLEVMARKWMASKDGHLRKIGVNAIAHFKSPENIRLVQQRLKDPFKESYSFANQKPAFDVLTVREAAKDTLDRWDVPWEPVHKASVAASRLMIRVPAGEFTMGGTPGAQDAGPERKVFVDEYWIGKTPVTVAQFRAFCKASGFRYNWKEHRPPHGYKDDHPMVNVLWEEARAFCKWVGGDLPTEEQWEKAARGTDGRRFPWGNEWDASRLHGWENHFTTWRATAPVGSYPSGASPYGCLDLIGNVWQWCLGGSPTARPTRGSDFETSDWDKRFTQVAGRGFMHGEGRLHTQGFRVAADHEISLP